MILSMILSIGGLRASLESDSPRIRAYWRHLFGDRILGETEEDGGADVRLSVSLVETLPPLPNRPAFFVDPPDETGVDSGILEAIYGEDGTIIVNFFDGGVLTIPSESDMGVDSSDSIPTSSADVTEETIRTARFDDITTVGLAPLLRRQDRYILHASGVSLNGQAVLFVGRSKSGKSTTCINLVLNGWKLLSNDVIVLEKSRPILAHPLSDFMVIRPKTIDLLPELDAYVRADEMENPLRIKGSQPSFPTHKLVKGDWSPPAEVRAICFPQIEDREETVVEKFPSTIALARMLEESLDQWDKPSLVDHTMLLGQLSQQADCYMLKLGRDLPQVPHLLESLLT